MIFGALASGLAAVMVASVATAAQAAPLADAPITQGLSEESMSDAQDGSPGQSDPAEDEPAESAPAEHVDTEPTEPVAGVGIQAASLSDIDELKNLIESSTASISIELEPKVYTFDANVGITGQIVSPLGHVVELVGAVDADGQPATTFQMGPNAAAGARFLRAETGTLKLSNIRFTGTTDKNGGVSARNIVATNTIFTNNHTLDAVNGGGAIRITGGDLSVDHSSFTNNSSEGASDGGAISSQFSGSVRINDSVFDGNRRTGNNNQYGGAISVKQPGVPGSVVEITDSIFTNNVLSATGSWSTGGAVRIYGTTNLTSVLIDNSLFKDNKTTVMLTQSGGAIGFMDTAKSTVSNCTFIGN
ncbi:hypothetical protein G7067_11745 [Leucobacter insecticola]|uniref:Right handed beta helix domain-containing protein n=1 Tax=Leucobacter insecticola TaxID=2714934 RepID=A0A6G8FKV6_9MICO|nr:hypothetical protein [Leucobacter insecticola]QIM16919.1 hypothetical protein G7067_11745 [Leucobacter insecticola]